MASWPPPAMKYGQCGSGEMAAELRGRSALNWCSSSRVFVLKSRTNWSVHEVTKSVWSDENCISVIFLVCTSTMASCSPVFGFQTRSVVSSETEKIFSLSGPHSARVTFEVWPKMVTVGQSGWFARLLSSRSQTKTVGTLPMMLSSTERNWPSPIAKPTHRTGAVCFHEWRHSPVDTSHSLHMLSAEPVSSFVESKLMSRHQTVPQCPW
mmetsp:Transcript_39193/g.86161  ORF Transcript_39193/g.86161 Transcript_39193/m.86161 type:complete len:209 (-) Transcript_39193:226-852(-)